MVHRGLVSNGSKCFYRKVR